MSTVPKPTPLTPGMRRTLLNSAQVYQNASRALIRAEIERLAAEGDDFGADSLGAHLQDAEDAATEAGTILRDVLDRLDGAR